MRELVAAVALAVTASTACSFAVVRAPAAVQAGVRPRCHSSVVAPVIDTALTALLAWAAVSAQLRLNDLGPPPPDGDHSGERKVAGLQRSAAILTGVVFAGSATYGYVVTARCRAAIAAAPQ